MLLGLPEKRKYKYHVTVSTKYQKQNVKGKNRRVKLEFFEGKKNVNRKKGKDFRREEESENRRYSQEYFIWKVERIRTRDLKWFEREVCEAE
jgi:hypothetical protein